MQHISLALLKQRLDHLSIWFPIYLVLMSKLKYLNIINFNFSKTEEIMVKRDKRSLWYSHSSWDWTANLVGRNPVNFTFLWQSGWWCTACRGTNELIRCIFSWLFLLQPHTHVISCGVINLQLPFINVCRNTKSCRMWNNTEVYRTI